MWQRIRLKYLAAVPIANGLGEAGTNDNPDWPRYVRTTDIAGPTTLRSDVFASLPPEVAQKASLKRSDIVMTAAGATIGKSFRYESDAPACYAGYLVRFRPGPSVDSRFISYWTESSKYWDQILSGRVTSTIDNFSASRYQNLRVDLPPLDQQRAIADYLDRETGRIDRLISVQRRLIELLNERLQSNASSAVWGQSSTSFDDPARTLPSNWIWRQNKTFLREVIEKSEDGREELLSVSHLTGVTPRSEKDVSMFEAESTVGYKIVRPGDFVLNTMWAWMGACGISDHVGIVSPAYGVYRFFDPQADPAFFGALFRSRRYVDEMTRFSRGVWTSRLRLYPESFLALNSPFPPLETQREIVAGLEQQTNETRSLIRRTLRLIGLLGERRQALVTAAIQGQMSLPESVV